MYLMNLKRSHFLKKINININNKAKLMKQLK
jgi:hypothetical protein